jgi:RNA polymerase sigma-70 factor (ECF subfamily)
MLRLVKLPSALASGATEGAKESDSKDPLLPVALEATKGGASAERTLLRAVGPSIVQIARVVLGANHPDVADVCQEANLALLQALPRFRGECTVTHFACRVAVLTALNARRRDRVRMLVVPDVEPEALSDEALCPADLYLLAQRRQTIRSLLDELPEPQACALAHHVMLGHTIEETAAAQGTPLATIKSRLRYALKALHRRITGDPAILEIVGGGHG